MGGYVDANLIKDERVLHRGALSVWALSLPGLLGLVLIPFYGLGLLILALVVIRYYTTELAVTNKRVIVKVGWIGRNTIEMNLNKIESMQVNQSVFGRMMNYGSLTINGTGTSHAPIPGIDNPLAFRRAFMESHDQQLQPAR